MSGAVCHGDAMCNECLARAFLLNFDADPWLDLPGVNGFKIGSYVERMAFSSGNGSMAETLFRIARSGYLPQGPEDAINGVFSELSSVAEKFASGTGPEARHTAWRLDQTLQVLGKVLGRDEEADAIRARLTVFDYEGDGGWYLAEDEIHARYDGAFVRTGQGRRDLGTVTVAWFIYHSR